MAKNREYFQNYLTSEEAIIDYITRKRHPRSLGNHLEIQAMSELYNRPFEVYEYSSIPVRCVSKQENANRVPIRISYHRKCHFNSLYDPNASPKLGLGLGLNKTFRTVSGLQQELKKRESEIKKLEKNMMKDKIFETDVEMSEKAMLRQAMQESMMQSKNKANLKRKLEDSNSNDKFLKLSNEDACCSKSLDGTGFNNKLENSVRTPKDGAGKNTSFGKDSSFNSLPESSKEVKSEKSTEDDDEVIQHILELSKHEF